MIRGISRIARMNGISSLIAQLIVHEIILVNMLSNSQLDISTDGNLLGLKASVEWSTLDSRYPKSQPSWASAFRGAPISCQA